MRTFVFVSALVFSYFIHEIKSSFDALIKFENITAIWKNEKKSDQLYLVYPLEGGKILYPLVSSIFLLDFFSRKTYRVRN
jgi:hypothetical protein